MQQNNVEQGSYEWHCLRQGKVTGTTLKSALGTTKVQDTLLYKLVSERMTEPQIDDIGTAAVVRGTELEPLARKVVERELGMEFKETGMLLSEDMPHFGFSPDGVYIEDGVIVGGLEIKCPGSKKHVEYVINGVVPKEYESQVKAPFVLSDSIQWWYFASYDDRNYEKPLLLIKVTRDQFKTIDEDREKLSKFIERVEEAHANLTF